MSAAARVGGGERSRLHRARSWVGTGPSHQGVRRRVGALEGTPPPIAGLTAGAPKASTAHIASRPRGERLTRARDFSPSDPRRRRRRADAATLTSIGRRALAFLKASPVVTSSMNACYRPRRERPRLGWRTTPDRAPAPAGGATPSATTRSSTPCCRWRQPPRGRRRASAAADCSSTPGAAVPVWTRS